VVAVAGQERSDAPGGLVCLSSTVTFNLSKCNLDGCISNFQRYTLESVLATLGYGGREEPRISEARTRPFVDGRDDADCRRSNLN
jgi:hypothetical protein